MPSVSVETEKVFGKNFYEFSVTVAGLQGRWVVKKRYSDFDTLNNQLKKGDLPPKTYPFQTVDLEMRSKRLREYLESAIGHQTFDDLAVGTPLGYFLRQPLKVSIIDNPQTLSASGEGYPTETPETFTFKVTDEREEREVRCTVKDFDELDVKLRLKSKLGSPSSCELKQFYRYYLEYALFNTGAASLQALARSSKCLALTRFLKMRSTMTCSLYDVSEEARLCALVCQKAYLWEKERDTFDQDANIIKLNGKELKFQQGHDTEDWSWVAYSNDDCLILAFRGTQIFSTWATAWRDLTLDLMLCINAKNWFGEDVQQAMERCREEKASPEDRCTLNQAIITGRGNSKRILITGHSLGGAKAIVVAEKFPVFHGGHVFNPGSPDGADGAVACKWLEHGPGSDYTEADVPARYKPESAFVMHHILWDFISITHPDRALASASAANGKPVWENVRYKKNWWIKSGHHGLDNFIKLDYPNNAWIEFIDTKGTKLKYKTFVSSTGCVKDEGMTDEPGIVGVEVADDVEVEISAIGKESLPTRISLKPGQHVRIGPDGSLR